MTQPAHQDRAARPEGARTPGARCRGRLALLPARLPVRDVARPGRRGLGRRRQPLPRLRGRHRRVQHRAQPPGGGARRSRRRRRSSCTSRATTGTRARCGSPSASRARADGEPVMSFFCQSGTEAVEGALKLARYVTRPAALHRLPRRLPRPHHGLARASPRASTRSRRASSPTMPGVTHVPYPNPLPAAVRRRGPGPGGARLHRGRAVRAQPCRRPRSPRSSSSRSRARAATWCRRTGFLAGLRALCDRHGILLIFDEVQSGIGRTGRMFACEHWGVRPDIMTSPRAWARDCRSAWSSPSSDSWRSGKRGAHGNTYGGNPLCCAAALATLDLVADELHGQRRARRRRLHGAAARAAARHPVHRRGARQGPDDRHGAGRDRRVRARRRGHCATPRHARLPQRPAAARCGDSTVRFMPPLCVSLAEIDEAIAAAAREPRRGPAEAS